MLKKLHSIENTQLTTSEKGQTASIIEDIKMHKKLCNSQVINDNGNIDKTFGDKYTTEFRKYNKD